MVDSFDPPGDFGDHWMLETGLLDPEGSRPDESTSKRGSEGEPAESPPCPTRPDNEAGESKTSSQAEEGRPLSRFVQREPCGDAGSEPDDEPGWKLRALRLEELFQPLVELGKTRLPKLPSTLWQRRLPYVRGARPLHCSIERRGKRA